MEIFELEIGSWTNLKGHAVAYWVLEQVENDNSVIMALDFAVSVFPFDGNLIATTFPINYFYSREEFMFYIQRTVVDLIFLGNIEKKENNDTKELTLTEKQNQQLNKAMQHYLNAFRNRISDTLENLSVRQRIELLKTWIEYLKNQEFFLENDHHHLICKQIENLITDLPHKDVQKKDINKFITLLYSNWSYKYELMLLYLQKFFSIVEEEYERIIDIKKEIQFIEKKYKK